MDIEQQPMAAPINEIIGSRCFIAFRLGQGDFLDPMCGSKGHSCEAAMIACNIRQKH
jgi:23S rRNA G2445 N2-methylase RlmL